MEGGGGRGPGGFLLKLCWDGGKDEMTACVSKNALEASTGICSARFDSGDIFIEFVIGLVCVLQPHLSDGQHGRHVRLHLR
jgi:hypothetical protein